MDRQPLPAKKPAVNPTRRKDGHRHGQARALADVPVEDLPMVALEGSAQALVLLPCSGALAPGPCLGELGEGDASGRGFSGLP